MIYADYEEQRTELERLSGLSSDEARELLLKNIEDELHHEAAIMIRDIEAQTKEEADRKQEKSLPLHPTLCRRPCG